MRGHTLLIAGKTNGNQAEGKEKGQSDRMATLEKENSELEEEKEELKRKNAKLEEEKEELEGLRGK